MRWRYAILIVATVAIVALVALWPILTYGSTEMPRSEIREKGQQNSNELIDLLWWMRRGGIPSFEMIWNDYCNVSGAFHHGPSR